MLFLYLKIVFRRIQVEEWSRGRPWKQWAHKEQWGWKNSRASFCGSRWWRWYPRRARGSTDSIASSVCQALLFFLSTTTSIYIHTHTQSNIDFCPPFFLINNVFLSLSLLMQSNSIYDDDDGGNTVHSFVAGDFRSKIVRRHTTHETQWHAIKDTPKTCSSSNKFTFYLLRRALSN